MENSSNSKDIPEKIVFINEMTGEITHERKFSEVPDSIKFLPNANGIIEPVVKISEMTNGNQKIIKQLGHDDVLLKSTIQILES